MLRFSRSPLLVALLFCLLGAACSYDSPLSSIECDREGLREANRVCQDGYWASVANAPDAEDTRDGTTPEDASDVIVTPDVTACAPDEVVCADACVDTNTSPQHCGACGLACVALGDNSAASCAGGRCTRACDAGFSDLNGDWITNPTADSDGCEAACTPTQDPTEVCDGLDNDCDGLVDEDGRAWYRDSDGDGSGATESLLTQCEQPSPEYTERGGDCNDLDPNVNPDIIEACDGSDCDFCNGSDDNCDGQADEGCPCSGDQTQPCFPFGNGDPDQGICAPGTQTCQNGTWGTCTGATGPRAESCNGDDDDCDGQTDEGVKTEFFFDADDDGFGVDGNSRRRCNPNGNYRARRSGDCDDIDNNINPGATEVCDGDDNDCDGNIDEDFPDKGATCSVGVGACSTTGNFICNPAQNGVVCDATAGSPSTEVCDGDDNDCDGNIDEDFPDKGSTCSVGVGACSTTGNFICNSAKDNVVCDATARSPSTEVCDGVDNDCDGDIDEDFPDKGSTCTEGVGACSTTGTYICNPAQDDVVCDASAGSPSTEVCDGVDNDCDGTVDGITRECGRNKGECSTGTETCTAGTWGDCQGSVGPSIEVCDGLDNDCDGDNDLDDDQADDWCEDENSSGFECVSKSNGAFCCDDPKTSSPCDD